MRWPSGTIQPAPCGRARLPPNSRSGRWPPSHLRPWLAPDDSLPGRPASCLHPCAVGFVEIPVKPGESRLGASPGNERARRVRGLVTGLDRTHRGTRRPHVTMPAVDYGVRSQRGHCTVSDGRPGQIRLRAAQVLSGPLTPPTARAAPRWDRPSVRSIRARSCRARAGLLRR